MKKLVMFLLILYVLPLLALSWTTLLDLKSFSDVQWGIAWFMTSASAMILANQQLLWNQNSYDKN